MKLYSFFDMVGETITNVMMARNDDMMLRQSQQLPDGVQGEHFVLMCIGEISDDGHITPDYRKICRLCDCPAELEKRLATKSF